MLFALIFFGAAALLALALHEVGHALGGRLRGLHLAMLIVGRLHLQRGADGRLRWRLNKKLGYVGGVVSCAPRSTGGCAAPF